MYRYDTQTCQSIEVDENRWGVYSEFISMRPTDEMSDQHSIDVMPDHHIAN